MPTEVYLLLTYCTHVLGYSEQSAFERIQASRAGSMEKVVEAGLDALLDRLDPERRNARRRAREERRRSEEGKKGTGLHPVSRRITLRLHDAVWERDGARCTFSFWRGASSVMRRSRAAKTSPLTILKDS